MKVYKVVAQNSDNKLCSALVDYNHGGFHYDRETTIPECLVFTTEEAAQYWMQLYKQNYNWWRTYNGVILDVKNIQLWECTSSSISPIYWLYNFCGFLKIKSNLTVIPHKLDQSFSIPEGSVRAGNLRLVKKLSQIDRSQFKPEEE